MIILNKAVQQMNNRYLCKGKRKDNNEWIEGYCVCNGEHCYIFSDELGIITINWKRYEVIPETVGQCTGLKDKNGKWIFEGNIIRTQPFSDRPYSSKAKYKQHIGVVEYRISHFKNSFYEQDYRAEWRASIKDYGKFVYCDWNEFFKCEVIGNIHDNPELLEAER